MDLHEMAEILRKSGELGEKSMAALDAFEVASTEYHDASEAAAAAVEAQRAFLNLPATDTGD